MRIVLIGTVIFSREMLLKMIAMGASVQGVCTAEVNIQNSDYVDLRPICEANNIPILRTGDINSADSLAWIRDRKPDIIFCFGWSRLIKQELLALPPLGVIGYHPALLPKNRGRHPIIWALVLGLNQTGSTFFMMDEDADTGDILSQKHINISDTDDANSLYLKVIETASNQLVELLPMLSLGQMTRLKQDVNQANVWRKRTLADGRIDWRMSANNINNLVRALVPPYPGAEFLSETGVVKVWKTIVVSTPPPNAEPGKVIVLRHGRPVVRCGDGAICLIETTPSLNTQIGAYL